ncbi:MAG: PIN/TRAM domain-containing protein [Eubacteriales bacterium]|nr:PIN/TRAM domain-containing protein [Eubacteriales bacterium]MDD3199429.1 PIN/TRAM domain-containing protein [Eubacteriales bacterium]MDD4121755.1 PIN/TRAM domain-containing protein [Eubacteriales bacterium]MDD4630154.1 PIN/TRAM domain-containing protein [Eubacteriales bacterium]
MIKKILRIFFGLVGVVFGYGIYLLLRGLIDSTGLVDKILVTETQNLIASVICSIIFGIIFFLLTPIFRKKGAKLAKNIETDLQKIPTNDIVSGTFGLIIGLVIAFLISQIFSGLYFFGTILSILTYIFFAYLGTLIATRKGKDIIPAWLSARKGSVPKTKGKGSDATPKIFDTSVIIDGRIADIMKTGFIEGKIVIPEFVLVELRHIADSSDGLKRNRGRRGLDILNRIQSEYGIEIYNTGSDKSLDEIPEVDVKLLKLAQQINGKVVTNDFNLNKVAMIKGVEVLNINELANTLKPVVLPGEDMTLFLVKEGKESNQAVAYLDDGTMIVVEEGRRFIGQTINVTVTSVLQTAAGRMIFAKPKR